MTDNPKPTQSWCVILQTFSKKSRKELITELTQGFKLDEQEAVDTIQNLPIILVDLINLNQAKQVKERFESSGAEIEITNHDIIKKQCFRIEWPSQPDLTYFDKMSGSRTPSTPSKIIPKSFPAPLLKAKLAPSSTESSVSLNSEETKVNPQSLTTSKDPSRPVSGLRVPPEPLQTKAASEPKLRKISWFPFGKSKTTVKENVSEAPLSESVKKPDSKDIPKPTPQIVATLPKAIVPELDQSEWRKRTEEIQKRLEKMGTGISDKDLMPAQQNVADDLPTKIIELNPHPESPVVSKVESNVSGKIIIEASKKKLAYDESKVIPISEVPINKNENLSSQSNELLEKIEQLERDLTEKKQHLEDKHAESELKNKEIEAKHKQISEVQDLGVAFAQKVSELEKALSEKEEHLNKKHSELEQKSEKERSLAEAVSQLEIRLAEKTAELESRRSENTQLTTQYEEGLKAKDQELDLIQRRLQEIAQKFQSLEQSIYEKQDLIASKDVELLSKDQKIKELQVQATDLDRKVADAQSLEKDKEQQIAGFHAREKEAHKKSESLDKTLIEMGESLRQRDEALRQRDEILLALERRVQDLAEKTGGFENLKATHNKLQDLLDETSGKYNRLLDEYRRFKSKNERKTTALARDMAEWVRKVDQLRQGLQKFNQAVIRADHSEEPETDPDMPSAAPAN